jgi:apolipoprotein N-acyltransferase
LKLAIPKKLWGPLAAMIASGAVSIFAFPPFNMWPLVCVMLIPLLWQCWQQPPKRAALLGFAFSLALGVTQLHWLIVVMTVYGQVAWPLAILALVLLAGIAALYVTAFAALVAALRRVGISPIFSAPIVWTGLEWLRAVALTGFPWLPLGNGLIGELALLQSAELWGVHGLSFWVVLINVLLTRIAMGVWQARRIGGREFVAIGICGLIIACGWWWGEMRLAQVRAQSEAAPTLESTVIQGNIPLRELWQRKLRETNLQLHIDLTKQAAAGITQRPWLVIWSESSAPFYLMNEARETRMIMQAAHELDAYILTGTLGAVKKDGKYHPTNRSWMLGPGGRSVGWYDKVHLVPFGEYVPMQEILFFVRAVAVMGDNFIPGKEGATLDLKGVKLGPLICYESIFPELALAQTRQGARLLINQTNDSWYGRTVASAQHMSHMILRSVENRRASARSANTGISAFIMPDGSVSDELGLMTQGIATKKLPLMDGLTFYVRSGEVLGPACLIIALLGGALAWFRARKQ